MEEEKRPEGLIQRLIKKWAFSKRFTKEEREELRTIEKQTYMNEARVHAKQLGIEKADEDFGNLKGGKIK